MNAWTRIHERHLLLKRGGALQLGDLRARLTRLARKGHCDRTAPSRFAWNPEPRTGRRVWLLRSPGETAGEPLWLLRPGIRGARLSIVATADGKDLACFSLALDGTSDDGVGWTIAVHLTEKPEGEGACGHALLHCHVGPSLDHLPRVRVPMPALSPVELLDWALTVVVPEWEPSPWPQPAEAS